MRSLPRLLALALCSFAPPALGQDAGASSRHPRTAEVLGIEFAVTSSKIRRALIRTETPYGFAVKSVARGSLADRAGIAKGTVVLEVDGAPLREVAELEAVLERSGPGAEIRLLCSTRKARRRLLDRRPWVEREVTLVLPAAQPRTAEVLGIEFAVTSSKIRRALIRTETPYGFAVKSVARGSLADRAGIAKGTVVLEVDGAPLREVAELEAVLERSGPGAEIRLLCSTRKARRRLLDRRPWVEREVTLVLPATGEEGLRSGSAGGGRGDRPRRRI